METKLLSRTIKVVRSAPLSKQWGGHIAVVDPHDNKLMDPFIFLVHHVHSFGPGEVTGFPPHPHRGFETVTYCIDGGFDHGDSRGNSGRYGNGDVQWMTAGKGILHSEMFVTNKNERSTFNGFQLWVNLPKRLKMCEPSYDMLWKNQIPEVEFGKNSSSSDANSWIDSGKATIKIIAGRVNDVKSNVEKATPMSIFHVKLDSKSIWRHLIPRDHNAIVYMMEGPGLFGPENQRKEVTKNQYAVLNEDGDQLEVFNPSEKTLEFMMLEGKPFKEPFAHQGPFVMNTKEELREAAMDFQRGLFGEMEEPYIQLD